MKYMLLIYSNENDWTEQEWKACTIESTAICHELSAKQEFLGASPLHPVATAKSVRVRDNAPLITDGPFAETAEQLGGYFLIEVNDLDAAIQIAARLPAAKKGTVEIRPIRELEGLPHEKHPTAQSEKSQFLMLCYDDAEYWTRVGEAAHNAALAEAIALAHEMDSKGDYLVASPLQSTDTATSVRVRDGKRIVSDGPFAETREILGGFYLIQANSMEEAMDYAARHPGGRVGTVEVRKVYALAGMPDASLA